MNDEGILHEIKELHQWKLDGEQLDINQSYLFADIAHTLNLKRFLPKVNTDIFEFHRLQLPWLFAVPNEDRTLLAILQEEYLEIRLKHNDYQTPIGRASVPVDENPVWRKLTWSSDGIIIVFANSNGEVRCYDALANLICSIPKVNSSCDSNSVIPSGAVVSLMVLEKRTKSSKWPYELLVLDYRNQLRSYFVSSTEGYESYHTFSFIDIPLTAATYVPSFNILVVAFSTSSLNENSSNSTLGLSTWRLLNDYPYYRLVKPNIENLSQWKPKKSWFHLFSNKNKRIVVYKMVNSSNGKYLACLHSCGAISIWILPQLIVHKICYVNEENLFSINENFISRNGSQEFIVSDLNWCTNTNLSLTFSNGMIIITGIDNLSNLLASINFELHTVNCTPHFTHPYPKIINACDINNGFLILSCKRSEFSSWRRDSNVHKNHVDFNQEDDHEFNNTNIEKYLFLKQIMNFFIHFEFWSQQKKYLFVEKTYEIFYIKKVTAEELYKKLIDSGEYTKAINFAKSLNLDENLVFIKQWETSYPVTIESIENYLLKVTNKWWIIQQCCERIPETLDVAEALLNHGLHFTDFDVFLSCDSYEKNDQFFISVCSNSFDLNLDKISNTFPESQLHLINFRRHLLLYLDALNLYKEIIESSENTKYNKEMYYKMRAESTLSIIINFARDGNTKAVAKMFTYYRDEILPFWLQILDNIPESISPSTYKQLLPKFDEHNNLIVWEQKNIREADWSESGKFSDLIKPKMMKDNMNIDIPQFPFTVENATKWYDKRVRKIIEQSGLVDYALELINIALKNNIEDMSDLQHNVLVMDTLLYDLMVEESIELVHIENLSDDEKLRLLMSKYYASEELFLEAVPSVLLQFLSRCESLRPNTSDKILNSYLKHLSEQDLNLPFIFIKYISENDPENIMFSDEKIIKISLQCIYACQCVDQTDVAFKIIQYLPEEDEIDNVESKELSTLCNQLTKLQIELEIAEILQTYNIFKTVQALHDNENNTSFQNDIFTLMVNYKLNTSVTKQNIQDLLNDMSFIQENLFNELPRKVYLQVFAYAMLTCSRYDCIEDIAPLVLFSSDKMSKNLDNFLTLNETVSVIIDAVQYYFTISKSYEDPFISYARSCLNLVKLHPDVEKEKRFIEALKELTEFGIQISPLEVRMKHNELKVVEEVLKQNPKAYKNVDGLVKLAKNLEMQENDKNELEFSILTYAAKASLQLKDYFWCSNILNKLIEKNGNKLTRINQKKIVRTNRSYWEICKNLCEVEEYTNLDAKMKFIKHALIDCPDEKLFNLVELRNKLEIKMLQKQFEDSVRNLENSKNIKIPGITVNENESPNEKITQKEIGTDHNQISSFINLLQSSSSNVLNVTFWKNTFSFNSNRLTDETEMNINFNCKRLGSPEYYKDVHQKCDCICLNSGISSKSEKNIFFLLLRLYYHSFGITCNEPFHITKTNIKEVISQLISAVFQDDCLLSLCLLFLLNDKIYSEKVFSILPDTDVKDKFALCFYCLKSFMNEHSNEEFDIQKNLLQYIRQALSSLRTSNSDYTDLIIKYKSSLDKRHNVDKLENLGYGIDPVRFFSDETYKIDSVLGLAMYEERDKLDIALKLGYEYGVPVEDIICSHITLLFLSRNLSLLTERLKEPLILETLKSKSDHVTEKLISDVYGGLNGCDYQILLLYYALINQIAENKIINNMKAKEHMKLLRKIKSFSKSIDYKMLTAVPLQIIGAVLPAVFSGEAANIINLLSSLPPEMKRSIDVKDVLKVICEKTFFNGPANMDYTKRFEICCVLLEKMEESYVIKIIDKFIFSEHSVEIIDYKCRKKILLAAIKFFSTKIEWEKTSLTEKLENYLLQLD